MASRLRPTNVSYFAFTATPKNKTLELFGRPNAEGRPVPFHVYSMRQAIEEGFILDVLKNYTTYTAYYRLQQTGDDPEVKVDKASKALSRFLRLHPYNIAQKVEVIVEHFREFVIGKIEGRAKAMIVTDSRKAAVRYKVALDKYLREHGVTDCRALVAFSGKVNDPETGPTDFSESSMNPQLRGLGIAEAFNTDEYRLLLVANKYQTGFDQPLLHTMYVDKRLSGVLAVQTLSRLNRTCREKEDTFVLDFVNDADEILDSFKPYFRTATLMGVTDPNLVHELQLKLDAAQVYHASEIEGFARAFFDPKRKQAALHGFLKPAADRFAALDAEKQDAFRKDLGSFLRLYEFLSQIVPYEDPELEQRYAFGRHLMPRLVNLRADSFFDLEDEVTLTHYRLQKLGTQVLQLQGAEPLNLKPVSDVGTGQVKDLESQRLSEIVGRMNDLFSGDLSEADKVAYATHIRGKLLENDKLAEQAQGNTLEQFKLGDFDRVFSDVVIEGLDKYQDMASQVLNNERIRDELKSAMVKWVYDGLVGDKRLPA
jgi:type I restriction enzyme R subunit